ncbi:hypothetical protein SporoP37_12190 [Sporosarcina sp. P37]|uniref:hypothetical protein n=1 Tax=unclassified Sporosarcina TaxID=2647733 RepID=UPI000A17E156|nr:MULTISPECIES: hypothetical protein [unclassified Sporosarcina]ARK25339.1 hypothetical protein SporoP37_12190 [Sporosarcina sp. P37]PID17136.1 hypothetical protein CSV62_15030 [Sporosarcina sp. P35]
MKRLLCSAVILLMMMPIHHRAHAEEVVPVLSKAEIQIVTNDDHYTVIEQIQLGDIQENHIEVGHTLSKLADNGLSDISFTSDGKDIQPTIENGDLLDKYMLELPRTEQGTADYTIEYTVPRSDQHFDIPLFVPDIAAVDAERNVHLQFEAPEGMEIQKNSFPNIVKGGQQTAEKHMTNIPSKVSYVFADKTIYFHSYNIVSFIALFALLILLVSWGAVEVRKSKGRDR